MLRPDLPDINGRWVVGEPRTPAKCLENHQRWVRDGRKISDLKEVTKGYYSNKDPPMRIFPPEHDSTPYLNLLSIPMLHTALIGKQIK